MSPFERLIQDLKAAQRMQGARAVFFKAMPDQPVDVLASVKRAKGKAEDRKIAGAALDGMRGGGAGKIKGDAGPAYDAQKMIRALLDANHRRALQPGDMDRATRAIEMGLPVPRDVLVRINGAAK